MAITQGGAKVTDVVQASSNSHASVHGGTPDVRRLYNFGDRVSDLSPEESPFFVYLSKVSKVPTDDSVFRFLEDRSKIDWTSREFLIAGQPVGDVVAGTSYSFAVDTTGGASVDWLIKGMVFAVATDAGHQVIVRVDSAPTDDGSDTSFTGKVISTSTTSGAGIAVANNDKCQVIGTAFAEGTGSPDVFSSEIDDNYGYTQIFKTACEMTNTAIATKYRGYANEWERIWAMKLREHKVDIERAMLFSQKARQGSVQYTEGLCGHIMKNSTAQTAHGTALEYTSGQAYSRVETQANLTYDLLLGDLEVLFDPARGGSGDRLVLSSLPVITFFNKLGDGAFMDASIGYGGASRYNFDSKEGAFGHKVMNIETIHGTLHLVKEPLFRGVSSGFMLFADMSKLAYRPLVGNGINRDTYITTNVQSDDEDLRKDMILTEAGLEVTLPESHLMYVISDL